MAASPATVQTRRAIPPRIHSTCEFVQVLMKLQRAANLIASTLDIDALLDRVVNDIADSIGDVKVAVWLRADDTTRWSCMECVAAQSTGRVTGCRSSASTALSRMPGASALLGRI